MKYEVWFRICFAEICRKYGLTAEVLTDNELALVGKTFMLAFIVFRDDVIVAYIRRDYDGSLVRWDIDKYITLAISEEDRVGITKGNTTDEISRGLFLILSRTLLRRFGEMLSGGTAWMEEFASGTFGRVEERLLRAEQACAERNHI